MSSLLLAAIELPTLPAVPDLFGVPCTRAIYVEWHKGDSFTTHDNASQTARTYPTAAAAMRAAGRMAARLYAEHAS